MSAVIPLELYNALEPQSIGDTLDPLPKASPLQTELRKCFFSTDDMLNYLKREHRQVIETLQTVEEITQQDRPTIEQISEMFKSGKRNKQSTPGRSKPWTSPLSDTLLAHEPAPVDPIEIAPCRNYDFCYD